MEAVLGSIKFIKLVQKHTKQLLDAVRGAGDKRSPWYDLCKELGDNCVAILSLLDNISDGLNQHRSRINTESIDVAMQSLDRTVKEGINVVLKCHDAGTFRLFTRGNTLKKEFQQVARQIAQALQNIPLAQLPSTMERTVCDISGQLQNARFVLSEEDKARLQS